MASDYVLATFVQLREQYDRLRGIAARVGMVRVEQPALRIIDDARTRASARTSAAPSACANKLRKKITTLDHTVLNALAPDRLAPPSWRTRLGQWILGACGKLN